MGSSVIGLDAIPMRPLTGESTADPCPPSEDVAAPSGSSAPTNREPMAVFQPSADHRARATTSISSTHSGMKNPPMCESRSDAMASSGRRPMSSGVAGDGPPPARSFGSRRPAMRWPLRVCHQRGLVSSRSAGTGTPLMTCGISWRSVSSVASAAASWSKRPAVRLERRLNMGSSNQGEKNKADNDAPHDERRGAAGHGKGHGAAKVIEADSLALPGDGLRINGLGQGAIGARQVEMSQTGRKAQGGRGADEPAAGKIENAGRERKAGHWRGQVGISLPSWREFKEPLAPLRSLSMPDQIHAHRGVRRVFTGAPKAHF